MDVPITWSRSHVAAASVEGFSPPRGSASITVVGNRTIRPCSSASYRRSFARVTLTPLSMKPVWGWTNCHSIPPRSKCFDGTSQGDRQNVWSGLGAASASAKPGADVSGLAYGAAGRTACFVLLGAAAEVGPTEGGLPCFRAAVGHFAPTGPGPGRLRGGGGRGAVSSWISQAVGK